MRVLRAPVIEYDHGATFNLWGLGDLHLGCPTVNEKALRADVAAIRDDPNALVVLMGDYADLIDARDKRFGFLPIDKRYWDAQTAPGGIPAESAAHVVEILSAIQREKILGVLEGNHETSVYQRTNYSLATEVAAGLNVQHLMLGYEGFIVVPFRRRSNNNKSTRSVVIQAAHGAAAPRRSGSLYNNAEVLKAHYPTADIILRGHGHQRVAQVYEAVEPGTKHVRACPWVYAMTGTYKVGRYDDKPGDAPTSTYEARKDFFPKTLLGPPIIHITPTLDNGQNPHQPAFDLTVTV